MARVRATSIAAHRAFRPGSLLTQILDYVETFGVDGCIQDDISAKFRTPGRKDSTMTPRTKELEEASLVFRNGDTRTAPSGRAAMVIRHHKHAAAMGVTLPTSGKPSRTYESGIEEGLRRAASILRTAPSLSDATRGVIAQIRPH